jgi:hypothetical protein
MLMKRHMGSPVGLLGLGVVDPIARRVAIIISDHDASPGLGIHLLPLVIIDMGIGLTPPHTEVTNICVFAKQPMIRSITTQWGSGHAVQDIHGGVDRLGP